LFLWAEATAVRLLGFNEYALRLLPLLVSIAGLFLFQHVAKRLLRGWALVFALGWFAVSYPMIRYAAEAKPYGTDLFLGLIQVAMIVEWRQRPERTRWLWALAAVAPLAAGLSYPTVFLAGGIGLFVFYSLWRERMSASAWCACLAYGLAVAGTFLTLYLTCGRHQNSAELAWMQQYWKHEFPPLDRPLALPWWLVETHAGALLAFPFGGGNGGSTLTLICCLFAVTYIYRRRAWPVLALGIMPLTLHLAAAAAQRYPYGGQAKMTMYLGAVICLFAGLGTAELLARLVAVRGPRRILTNMVVAGLMLLAVGSMARDFWKPGKTLSDLRARDFARWFWLNAEYNAEVACLKTDLNLSFAPQIYQELNWSAMYLCNQRIYSPRHARKEPLQLDRVAADRPLRCVEYCVPSLESDDAARQLWLDEMCRRYDMVGRETFPFVRYNKKERDVVCVECLEVYKFVPKTTADSTLPSLSSRTLRLR